MIYYIFCVSLACVFRIICLFSNFSFFLRPSGDSKLLEEVVVPLAKTLGRMFGLSPTRHKTLSSFSHTGSVTYCGFFFFTCEPNYSCRMLRNVDDKRRLPFFFPSSQQSENGELWRPCENFPGKNQRAKNLYRMPRVSMRTSGKSEYLSDLAGWFLFDHAGVLKALYVGDAHVTRTRNVYRVVILGLVREDTPNSASNPVTSSESTWQEGDDLLCNASQTAIVQHLEPFNN